MTHLLLIGLAEQQLCVALAGGTYQACELTFAGDALGRLLELRAEFAAADDDSAVDEVITLFDAIGARRDGLTAESRAETATQVDEVRAQLEAARDRFQERYGEDQSSAMSCTAARLA